MMLPLKWEFPGGKIENGETEESCILREIKEELNISIELVARLTPSTFRYPGVTVQLIPFLANYCDGDIKLAEHKRFQWLTKDKLAKLDWAEADVPILNEILNL